MKVKLIYKEGIVYTEMPGVLFNRDRVRIPKREHPTAYQVYGDIYSPVVNEHTFNHVSFEMINGENHKVLIEV